MTIDWTKPLELLDGTPVRLSDKGFLNMPGNPDQDGDYWIEGEDGQKIADAKGIPFGRICVSPEGVESGKLFVRNRPEVAAVAEEPQTATLRDQFAMAALFGCMSYSPGAADIAAFAYQLADAMMEARK